MRTEIAAHGEADFRTRHQSGLSDLAKEKQGADREGGDAMRPCDEAVEQGALVAFRK